MPPDRFDPYFVVDSLRRAAGRIALGALIGGVLAGAGTYFALPYVSDGMYGLGAIVNRDPVIPQQPPMRWPRLLQYGKGLSLPELKVDYPRLDGDGFRKYLEQRKVAHDDTLEKVLKRLANADTRPEILNPQYGSTRADQRELGDSAKMEPSAIAMRITVASRDGNAALRATTLLGEFVGQTVFDSQAGGLIARRLEQHDSQKLAFENDLLKHRFDIVTTSEKVTRLRALQREFPESAAGAGRQVVSIAEGGARYLTPAAQVVGLEATVADLRQQIATTERSRRKAELLASYYRKASLAIGESADSRTALRTLETLIDRTFGDGKDDETVREARNDAALDLYALQTLREQGLRFVSGPTPPWRDESRVWKHTVAGVAIGALVVAVLAVLGSALARRPPG